MSTTLTIADGPKMLREALCVAEHAVNRNIEPQNQHGAPRILAALIAECDRHRPLGPDGKHGDRHTDTCGCDDMPLDPSKVKAGDTVAVRVEADPKNGGTFEVTGKAYMDYGPFGGAGVVKVGAHSLDGYNVTLTAHQPAPEPEWKPGTVGTATVQPFGADVRVLRSNSGRGWYCEAGFFEDAEVTGFVPDEPRPLPTRNELVKAMHDDYLKGGEPRLTVTAREHLADAVLTFLRGESR